MSSILDALNKMEEDRARAEAQGAGDALPLEPEEAARELLAGPPRRRRGGGESSSLKPFLMVVGGGMAFLLTVTLCGIVAVAAVRHLNAPSAPPVQTTYAVPAPAAPVPLAEPAPVEPAAPAPVQETPAPQPAAEPKPQPVAAPVVEPVVEPAPPVPVVAPAPKAPEPPAPAPAAPEPPAPPPAPKTPTPEPVRMAAAPPAPPEPQAVPESVPLPSAFPPLPAAAPAPVLETVQPPKNRGGALSEAEMNALPRLGERERSRHGLTELRLNVLRVATPTQPEPSAIINLKKVYVGELIPDTRARLIGVQSRSIAIEIEGTGERYRVM